MSASGKDLEQLVRTFEELVVPRGFTVTSNRKVSDDDGVPLAELDIEVRGRFGSTDICWLIECRDRPSEGPAPASWIEQLVGRRARFSFNKVTAVSSTGFSAGATSYAALQGIELRTMEQIVREKAGAWLGIDGIVHLKRISKLTTVRLGVDGAVSPTEIEALQRRLQVLTSESPVLRSTETSNTVSAADAFRGVIELNQESFADIEPNRGPKAVSVVAKYPNDGSHFVIDTDAGPMRVKEILFIGTISLERSHVPLGSIVEYRRDADETVAQIATVPVNLPMGAFRLELHNVASTGEIHVLMRKVED
jgi:hypothetical protein